MRSMAILFAAAAVLCFVAAGTAGAGGTGATVFAQCAACHQPTGKGVPGAFPPLAGHLPALVKADRTYPIKVVLYGLEGKIDVEGKTYNGEMPSFGKQLKDDEIASVLNYALSQWGNKKLLPKGFKDIKIAEVKAQRAKHLSPSQVHQARQKLRLK